MVEIGEGEEFFVTQNRDQPALRQKYTGFDFGFVLGLVGTRRHHGDVVVLGELEIGAIEIGLVAAGSRDCGLGIIGDHQLRGTLKEFQGLDVTLDPVGKLLAERGAGKGVGTGAEHCDEQGGGLGFAGGTIVNRDGRARPVDKHLLARAVILA